MSCSADQEPCPHLAKIASAAGIERQAGMRAAQGLLVCLPRSAQASALPARAPDRAWLATGRRRVYFSAQEATEAESLSLMGAQVIAVLLTRR